MMMMSLASHAPAGTAVRLFRRDGRPYPLPL